MSPARRAYYGGWWMRAISATVILAARTGQFGPGKRSKVYPARQWRE